MPQPSRRVLEQQPGHGVSGEQKAKRFLLAIKVRQAKDAKLTSDEVTEIKKVVAKGYSPLVVGRVWEIVDPASMEKK